MTVSFRKTSSAIAAAEMCSMSLYSLLLIIYSSAMVVIIFVVVVVVVVIVLIVVVVVVIVNHTLNMYKYVLISVYISNAVT